MANTNKQQPDFSNEPEPTSRQKTLSLSRDIEELQNGMRIDFDQKLSELAGLLARFKAMVIAPTSRVAANDSAVASEIEQDISAYSKVVPITKNITHTQGNETPSHKTQGNETRDNEAKGNTEQGAVPEPTVPAPTIRNIIPRNASGQNNSGQNVTNQNATEQGTKRVQLNNPAQARHFVPEPARFENGLYKLNSQLYRFRLELDQEMEFREEPLHIHFHQKSELSLTLKMISDKSGEKHPDN